MKPSHLTTCLIALCGIVATSTSPPAQETNKSPTATALIGSVPLGPRPNHVSLFLGGGDQSETGQVFAKKFGGTFYSTNQVVTLEQFTEVATEALKREGRDVAPDRDVAANVELSTGIFAILVYTQQKESCWVSFDSSGRITGVGGAKGFHGEGAWHREYKGGHPVGQAK